MFSSVAASNKSFGDGESESLSPMSGKRSLYSGNAAVAYGEFQILKAEKNDSLRW
jgi:hypothetical protein